MGQIATKPEFVILNSAEAAQQLKINNQLDNYDTACRHCRINRVAAQQIELCAAPIGAQEAINAVKLPSWLEADLKNTRIKIVFFKEGLPHTRESDTIYLPTACPNFETIFIHECIHISQRIWPERWAAAYAAVWNMHPATISLPDDLKVKMRFNPDTFTSEIYTWTAPSGARWTPILVFRNPDAPRLADVRLLFVNGAGGWQSAVPTEWAATFGTGEPSICEHPHEMAAYTLAGGAATKMAAYLAR